MESRMETTTAKLESMFEKADADLDHLSRKLDTEFSSQTDEASGQINKGELLEKISDIRKEYADVVKEAQAIQQTQKEAMEFFKTELATLCGALTQLQMNTGMDGEPNSEELEKVSSILGIPLPDASLPESELQSDGDGTSHSASRVLPESSTAAEPSELSACERRLNADDFIEVTDDEFQTVSNLVRGRVKLSEVNHTYRVLWQHFKEERNSEPLTPAQLFKMGLRVTGHTGEAKLKVLKSLKLLSISKKGDVKLV